MSNKKILKNTLALYTRQIINILITLYSLIVVLNELGTSDYGVYSVVTGFVTLLISFPAWQFSSEKAKQALVGINEKFANRNYT